MMDNQEYYYEAEPEPEGDRRRLMWAAGGAVAAALLVCLCCLCILAAFFAGWGVGQQIGTELPPTSGAPPEPVINYPVEGAVGEVLTFDGSGSQPGSSPIAAFDWDFGDGTTGSGAVVTHLYNAAGIYQVTLTVTGQDGQANTGGPVEVTIREIAAPTPTPTSGVPPEAIINLPVEGTVGQEVNFDGSASRPGSSPIASYDWNFGDGTTGNGVAVTHIYNAPGTYQVTLTVTGEDGLGSTGGPVEIPIREAGAPQPTPTIGDLPQPVMVFPTEAKVGEEVTFDGSQSQPGSSPIASYEWDFGDGGKGAGSIVFYAYDAAGEYQVTLYVTAEDGLSNATDPVPIKITE